MKKPVALLGLAALLVAAVIGAVFLWPERAPEQETQPYPKQDDAPPAQEPPPADAAETAPAEVVAPAPSEQLPDDLPATIRFYGIVADAATDAPVPEAKVFAKPQRKGADAKTAETQTDADGVFSFETPAAQSYTLTCRATGYARAAKDVAAPSGAPPGVEIRVDFLLQPGSGVAGRVTDAATGEGIPGARVRATDARQNVFERLTSGRDRVLDASTGEDGAYELGNLSAGAYRITVNASNAGYVFKPEQAVTLNLDDGETYQRLDFALERGAVVQGRVTNAAGEAVSGARVSVVPTQILEAFTRDIETLATFEDLHDTTNDDGRFEIDALQYETDFRLRAEKEKYAAASSAAFRIERGETPARIDMIVTRGSAVAGTARYDDGAPAAGHNLTLFPDVGKILAGEFNEPKGTTTDQNGAFVFEAVPAGTYSIIDGRGDPNFSPFGGNENAVSVNVDGIDNVAGLEITLARRTTDEQRESAIDFISGVV
ncbi:MAG TPA: hypothetical protein HPP77_06040 [Candidatus Hydrogenedentes bacterium]|nr:hypothetical protein [Candidatus Hydrogenedentota bacterium]